MRSEAKIGLAVVMLMAAVGMASASVIKGTKHDLSSAGGGAYKATNTDQICVFCHTPHNAIQNIPLWNRSNPSAGGFTLYSSSSMNNTPVKAGFTSDSISLFCMSCHDGATGLGSEVHNDPNGTPITMNTDLITGDANLLSGSGSLQNDHPVNFAVTTAGITADGNLGTLQATNPPTMKTAAVDKGFPLFKSGRVNGETSLECGSCHAVHDNTDAPFLRTTMKGSLLCLGCHVK